MLSRNPYILLSFINTKLRDQYASFEELCEDLDEDGIEIINILHSIGYSYSIEENQFKQ